MLAIRMQRTGRTGHAQFRLIVQDSRFSPKSGRVVAYIGSYNPHSKAITLDKEKAEQYLSKGAQPSPKLIKILKNEGVKLPEWVKEAAPKKRTTRNPEKLRKNRPVGEPAPEKPAPKAAAEPVEQAEVIVEASMAETPEGSEPETEEKLAEDQATEEPAPEETPADEKPAE